MSTVLKSPDIERAVTSRYSSAARAPQTSLCCPTAVDRRFLEAIPAEVLERDYGCGDPTRTLRPGETVLDLGSGAGKTCFVASQVVGPEGRVIGIDMNDDMLALARRSAVEVARRVGYANVSFRKGRIQDLALDLDVLDARLRARPVAGPGDQPWLDAEVARLRAGCPLVRSATIDVVLSSCVLNLVHPEDKTRLFREIHRVLRAGGRAVISDIVSDADVPEHLQADPELWSGCISGALREDRFLQAFADAGLSGVALLERGTDPWRTVEGIAFRSVTVLAHKGAPNACEPSPGGRSCCA